METKEQKLARFDGLKVPWGERRRLIERVWPSIHGLDWDLAMRQDPELMGEILRDIIKLDQAEPGRSGPRPPVDPQRAAATLRRMMGEDYSVVPFAETFRILADGKSYRALARKCFISLKKVHLYMTGKEVPPVDEIKLIAEAFGKLPSYFVEYRTAYVAAALEDRMLTNPDASIGFYRRLNQNG